MVLCYGSPNGLRQHTFPLATLKHPDFHLESYIRLPRCILLGLTRGSCVTTQNSSFRVWPLQQILSVQYPPSMGVLRKYREGAQFLLPHSDPTAKPSPPASRSTLLATWGPHNHTPFCLGSPRLFLLLTVRGARGKQEPGCRHFKCHLFLLVS